LGNVVLAFDGDPAGDEAIKNAMLTVLDLDDDHKDYIRSYVNDGRSFWSSLRFLSNQALSDEYRFWSFNIKGPEWLQQLFSDNALDCARLINDRANQLGRNSGTDTISSFNKENTITNVLASFGYQGVPGRSVKCPSHDDSSPSLSISRDDGRAYCFNQSCPLWHDGYGVDAFELNKILGS
jgi:hypothetical protein